MLTVRSTLELKPLRGTQTLAGKTGLGRFVRRPVIIELPEVLTATEEGDLLLTSVQTFHPYLSEFGRMLPKLNRRGVAGVLVKGQLGMDRGLEEFLALAEALDLPILHQPAVVSYTEIMQAFIAHILAEESVNLQASERLRQRLLATVLSGGLYDLAELLSKEVGNNCVVIDDGMGSILVAHCAQHGERCPQVGRLRDVQFLRVAPNVSLGFRSPHFGQDEDSIGWHGHWTAPYLCWTLTVDRDAVGRVYLCGCSRPLGPHDVGVLKHADTLLKLEFLKVHAHQEREERRRDFVRTLLAGDFASADAAVRRAECVGWRLHFPCHLVQLEAEGDPQLAFAALDPDQLAEELHRLSTQIVLSFYHESAWFVFLAADERASPAAVRRKGLMEIVQRIRSHLSARVEKQVYAGISERASQPRDVVVAWTQARQALALARRATSTRGTVHFADAGIYQILLGHPDSGMLVDFMCRTIGGIIRHDQETNGELLKTLSAYLAHDRNKRATAEVLSLHYNSLRYRLRRIRDILGDDWEEPSQRLGIEIALKIRCLLNVPSIPGNDC